MRFDFLALSLLCAAPFAAAAADAAFDPAEAAKLAYEATSSGNFTEPSSRRVNVPEDKRPLVPPKRTCGAYISPQNRTLAEAAFAKDKLKPKPEVGIAATPSIPVYWHIVSSGYEVWQGWIPDWQVQEQIRILNHDFASNPTGLTFYWAGLTRTVNADWFNNAGPGSDYAMKAALRQGGANALNIYSVGFNGGSGQGLLGYAQYPYYYQWYPTEDGVVIHYASVPGGTLAPYNEGKTASHEVGHWAGLYHTFENGCASPGDSIQDTAPEAEPAFGCPWGRDTCSGGGVDPINNIMDYGDDYCLTYFTWYQAIRVREQMSAYRGIVF